MAQERPDAAPGEAPPEPEVGTRTYLFALAGVVLIAGAAGAIAGLVFGGGGGSGRAAGSPTPPAAVSSETSPIGSHGGTSATPATPAVLTWERLDGALPAGASVHGVTNIGGRWFVNGSVGDMPAIWTSDEDVPRGWLSTDLGAALGSGERAHVTTVTAIGDNLIAIGSWTAAESETEAWATWTSSDGGAHWTATRTAEPPLRAIAAGGPGLIGAGWTDDGAGGADSFVMLSTDGRSWERLDPAAMRGSSVAAVATAGDRLVAAGAAGAAGAVGAAGTARDAPANWYSDDGGQTWTAGDPPAAAGTGAMRALARLIRGPVAVGVADDAPTAWVTDDGIAWMAHPIASTGTVAAVTTIEAGGLVAIGTGAEGAGVAWSSLDGVSWVEAGALLGDGVPMAGIAAFGTAVVAGGTCDVTTCSTPLWLGLPRD